MPTIRVLIAEDEEAVRQALVDLVSSDPEMEVVAIAADADEAIEAALREHPDVALVDVKMPGGGGPRAAREIVAGSAGTRVVALSAYEDRRTVLEMLRAGVVGYLVKGTAASEIIRTIRRTMRGEGSLSVEITADVIRELADLLDRSELLARELQELNRTKSDLIQVMSHELFTPITTIQGFALTVAEHGDRLTPDDVQELATGVEQASQRLRRLVGNLSIAARLDRESVEVTTRPVAVGEVLMKAVTAFPAEAARIVVPSDPITLARRVWADPDLATQAIVIGIENALDFGGEDAQVDVLVASKHSTVSIEVADHGAGIPEEHLGRIFEAFTQADGSATREHEGLGIGLYLARRIMRGHGGDVTASSGDGGGTTLAYTFAALEDERA